MSGLTRALERTTSGGNAGGDCLTHPRQRSSLSFFPLGDIPHTSDMTAPATIAELQLALDAAGVNPRTYSFISDAEGDLFRLAEFRDELGRGWHFYYAERGIRTGEVPFREEGEACAYFLRRVLANPTTRTDVA